MAFSSTRYLCVILVLFVTVRVSEGQCTRQELSDIFSCIIPHNQEFFDAIGRSGSSCDRSRITTSICETFGQIVTCIQGKNLSNDTCIPHAAGQINPQLETPCKIGDYFAVCKNVPDIWGLSTGNGAATHVLCMTSLMASLMTLKVAADFQWCG